MIAVTISIGARYQRLCEASACSFRTMTGINPIVLTERDTIGLPSIHKPHHLKFFIPECIYTRTKRNDHRILYFDADIVFIRPFALDFLKRYDNDFAVVRDEENEGSLEDANRCGVSHSQYFNSGFMLFNCDIHNPMLKAAYLLTHYYHNNIFRGDQSFLNIARSKLAIETQWLPSIWNSINFHKKPNPEAYVAHLNGLSEETPEAIEATLARISHIATK